MCFTGVKIEAKGPRKNNFLRSARPDSVVPAGERGGVLDREGGHLLDRDLDAGLVLRVHQGALHAQARLRRGGPDEVQDGFVGLEGDSRPVLTDLAEESVLDRVPLRGAAWVVGHGDGETVRVAETVLEEVLPSAAPVAVAPARVR